MSLKATILFLFFSTNLFGKAAPPNVEVAVEADVVVQKVTPVIQSAIDLVSTIGDSQCQGLSLQQSTDNFQVTVNGNNFYILTSNATINGVTYQRSQCLKYENGLGGGFQDVQIECSAQELTDGNTLPTRDPLVFYMRYREHNSEGAASLTIDQCPTSGTIVQ